EKKERIEALNFIAANRGAAQTFGQNAAVYAASFAGSVVSPINLVTGEVAGVAARYGVKSVAPYSGRFAGRYAPSVQSLFSRPINELIEARAPGFVGKRTLGELAEAAPVGFSTAMGFSLPEEIAKTYNPDTDAFN